MVQYACDGTRPAVPKTEKPVPAGSRVRNDHHENQKLVVRAMIVMKAVDSAGSDCQQIVGPLESEPFMAGQDGPVVGVTIQPDES